MIEIFRKPTDKNKGVIDSLVIEVGRPVRFYDIKTHENVFVQSKNGYNDRGENDELRIWINCDQEGEFFDITMAHEIMHEILRAEGFMSSSSKEIDLEAREVGNMITSSLTDPIIDTRLLKLGFDVTVKNEASLIMFKQKIDNLYISRRVISYLEEMNIVFTSIIYFLTLSRPRKRELLKHLEKKIPVAFNRLLLLLEILKQNDISISSANKAVASRFIDYFGYSGRIYFSSSGPKGALGIGN